MIVSLPPQHIAQVVNNPALGDWGDMGATQFLGGLIPALVSLGLVIGAVAFLFYFIMGAISWITSAGDKMKLEQARNRIITALVGLVILLSFIGILNLAERFFGIGLRRIEVGPFRIELTGDSGGGPGPSCPPCADPSHSQCGEYPDCWCAQICPT
jgi:hypothetical protein